MAHDRRDQTWNREFIRGDMDRQSEFSESCRGDRTDGRHQDSIEVRPFFVQQSDEVSDRRRTGERDDVGAPVRIVESCAQFFARRFRHNCFVGFDNVDVGSSSAQFARNDIAGYFGADEEYPLAFYPRLQAVHDGFGDIFFGNNIDAKAALFDCFLCGRTDGGDAEVTRRG